MADDANKPQRTPAQERARERFAPKEGQHIPVINVEAMDPDNAFWLWQLHHDELHSPDGPEWLTWAIQHGYTEEQWAASVVRKRWQQEYDERQVTKGDWQKERSERG